MLRLACGVSRHAEPDRAAEEVARQVERQLGAAPARAAVFFATTRLGPGFGQFERALRAVARTDAVVGCSAAGILGSDTEVEGGPGVSALVFGGNIEARRILVKPLRGRAEEVGRELGRAVRDIGAEPKTLLILADTYNLAPDELIAGVAAVAPGVAVVGGGATEDGSVGETTVVARGAASSNAVVALALGGVRVRTVVNQSCGLVDRWRTVTRAAGNRVLEIDHQGALPTYLAALPAILREDVAHALRVTYVALAEPDEAGETNRMNEANEGGEAARPFCVRPLLGADPRTEALLVGDEVWPGMRICLAVRDGHRARQVLDANLARFAESGDLAGALYFNAFDRGEALYGLPGLETAYLRRWLGDLPLAGLFCGAEFAPHGGRNRYHQYAGALVGFAAA